jgi:hypothetical protein
VETLQDFTDGIVTDSSNKTTGDAYNSVGMTRLTRQGFFNVEKWPETIDCHLVEWTELPEGKRGEEGENRARARIRDYAGNRIGPCSRARAFLPVPLRDCSRQSD